MDRLREGAPDAGNFLANIGKQRMCPGRSPAWASRSTWPNGRVNASAPQQRPDWESCESQFVTLAIDFCLRRAFTGPLEQLAAASTCCHTKGLAPLKAAPKYFSRAHSVTQESNGAFPTIVDKKTLPQRYTLCVESASKGPKWISSSPMTTVLADFCSALP